MTEVTALSRLELVAEVVRLRNAIREHRDQKGDDRCWMDDSKLYAALPEASGIEPILPPPEEMLSNCKRFIASRHVGGTPYVSPNEEIKKLREENERLRQEICDVDGSEKAQNDVNLYLDGLRDGEEAATRTRNGLP